VRARLFKEFPGPRARFNLVLCNGPAKRAETRDCPICNEPIPLRLLAQHAELETERVESILEHIGDLDVWADPFMGYTGIGCASFALVLSPTNLQWPARRPASRRRVTARRHPHPHIDHTAKMIRDVQRHRKARHALLRDATRDGDDDPPRASKARTFELCPVCQQRVPGDPDVINAHVDACLAHAARQESSRSEAERQQEASTPDEDVDVDVDDDEEDPWEDITAPDGTSRLRMRAGGPSARRLGFDVRDRNAEDVEVDVDIDGEDDIVFGNAQFTEADIFDGPKEEGLATEEHVEAAIAKAREAGDWKALVVALEGRIKLMVGIVLYAGEVGSSSSHSMQPGRWQHRPRRAVCA
jgi:hypothetical protein